MLVSIVSPAYNEEENLHLFYTAIAGVMSQTRYDWELILINDGSHDNTAPIIRELSQKDPRVRYLFFSRNFGSYPAISAGLLYARGDAVVLISSDLQDPPDLIPEFLQRWEAGADIVWGVRAERTDPGLKSFYANLFYWLVKKLIWRDFPSGGMDYGLFDRRIVDHFNTLPTRNTIPFFTIFSMGFKQEQIPYRRGERVHGISGWSLVKRVKAAVDVLVDFSYVPIRAISTIGFIISLLSFAFTAIVIFNRLVFGVGGWGWPSTIAIITFLGGVQLIVLGVLGEYLWRVAEQVRERPRFFIMERGGFDAQENPGLLREHYRPHSHARHAP